MLFDLYHGGHHGAYVRALLRYWVRRDGPGRLDVVVPEAMVARVPEIADLVQASPTARLWPVADLAGLREKTGRRAVIENDLRIGRALRRAVAEHRPDHCVLLYFDHVQASLATGLRFGGPVRFSGIYFRPSFYYPRTGGGGVRAALDGVQKRALLRLALRNRHVDTLFCLDPYAVGPVARLAAGVRVVALPDGSAPPDPPTADAQAARQRLGVEDGRRVVLLFGSLDPRKGVSELLEACRQLPDALARRACLVLAGQASDRAALAEAVAAARGALQVVYLDGFVPDATVADLFGAAALVALPYQRHVGSSGIAIRAAAAGVPVLGPAYGMLGATVREHRLGLAVDTTRPAEIARGLARFLDDDEPFPFDPAVAQAYADASTEEAMAATLFGHVLGHP